MNQMKKNFLASTLFMLVSAALLSGCVRFKTVTYQNRDYDTVFKSAVAGLCSDKKILVYDADKSQGMIKFQGRGLMSGPPNTFIVIDGASGGTPKLTLLENAYSDHIYELIASKLPAASSKPAETKGVPAETKGASDLDFERQKLDLEKEKLKLEREKLEFEKEKLKQR